MVSLYRAPDGSIWATTLSGVPGFMKATDDNHLRVSLKQIYADPVNFAEGDRIGSVGVMSLSFIHSFHNIIFCSTHCFKSWLV